MSPRNARNAYASAAVETVQPAQLLVMLYDALTRNLVQAEAAINDKDISTANEKLIRAQDIVGELISSLDPKAFEGGEQLMSLYTFWFGELLDANLSKDAHKVMAVRSLVEPMAETWREAAEILNTQTTPTTTVDSISVSS